MIRFSLPEAPPFQSGPVKAWCAPVIIPTYDPAPPDKNPSFVERRVYQGSSGRVYPLPCIDRVDTTARDRLWNALHLENAYLRVMILPELGGRIHVGLDKTTGYDFFYRQNVIKPALVGLAGPWISGGVEFNWPQHHRPGTFLPVDYKIEQCLSGSCIIWCSDHDPMNRMKGMHGICLHPDRSYIECKVRLYNRTPYVQTFLWWANVATQVHEQYQSFFPADITHVADHAKRAMSAFPLCEGTYYGVNYAERARNGVPEHEVPRKFVPTGNYAPNDLSWYANIPVPTSYMIVGSQKDFFGGYDHRRQAGLVHMANHHISPGKKQWTWGNHDFGYAWHRNLTDSDGPYIELMAGAYTDNQPDFSFLMPGETKTFSQYWYPIQKIGPPNEANRDAAVSLRPDAGKVTLGVAVTGNYPRSFIQLLQDGRPIREWQHNLTPALPWQTSTDISSEGDPAALSVVVLCNGRKLIELGPTSPTNGQAQPVAATEPLLPEQVKTNEELYLIGLHLDQYRHATRGPEQYWEEALRRDARDVRCNNALGKWRLRRGEFSTAERHFRDAIQRMTALNPNPYDGEPYYNLGLTLRFLGRDREAYGAFYKATWNSGWRAAGLLALAELDVHAKQWETAWEHLTVALRVDADQLNVRNLITVVLRRLGRVQEAESFLAESHRLDPLDYWTAQLRGESLGDNQARLDVAFQYLRCGLYEEADSVLASCDETVHDGSVPIVFYCRAFANRQSGLSDAAHWEQAGAEANPDYCFPSRLEEFLVLESVLECQPRDARAHYFLGNLLYDRGRHEEAISHWELAVGADRAYSNPWRNLAVAYFNVRGDLGRAKDAAEAAVAVNPHDARLLYERDQLWKRSGEAPLVRCHELSKHLDLAELRDDLTVELANLYNQTGEPEKALTLLMSRKFQPWEGGEGTVLGQFVRAQLALGRDALLGDNPQQAMELFTAALHPPANLGEDWHLLANRSNVFYWLGVACEAAANGTGARDWWTRSADSSGDFQDMSVRVHSEMTYYRALALRSLGRTHEARQLLRDLLRYAKELARTEPKIDYFATSLPTMLLFAEDLRKRNRVAALFMEAQASFGLDYERRGSRLLSEVLRLDPSHSAGADLRTDLQARTILAQRIPA